MEEYKQAYLKHLETLNYSVNTIKSYDEAIKRFQSYAGNKKVQDITEKDMITYKVSMKDEGLKPHSISNYLLTLKEFFRYLAKNFIILASPVENLVVPTIPRKLPEILSEQEMLHVLDSIKTNSLHNKKVKAIFEIFYSTGIRREELITLTLNRTNLNTGCLTIVGKFNKERVVPVSETALKSLQVYFHEVRPVYCRGLTDRLFLSKNGQPLRKEALAQIVRYVKKESGIHFNCQMIRRTCATHLLQNGASILHIAKLLGHETLETLSRYLRIDIKDIKETHGKVF